MIAIEYETYTFLKYWLRVRSFLLLFVLFYLFFNCMCIYYLIQYFLDRICYNLKFMKITYKTKCNTKFVQYSVYVIYKDNISFKLILKTCNNTQIYLWDGIGYRLVACTVIFFWLIRQFFSVILLIINTIIYMTRYHDNFSNNLGT